MRRMPVAMMITFTPMTTGRENKGLYYYGARYYDPKVSVWLSVDALAHEFPHVSPYIFCLNNPVNLVDPDGNAPDDYYNKNGKYVGSDGEGNNIRVTGLGSKEMFNKALSTYGKEGLRKYSPVVTVQQNSQAAVNKLYTESVENGVESKAYVVLDVKNNTLSIKPQPAHPSDGPSSSVNTYTEMTSPTGSYKSPDANSSNEVIVGQVHGHPGIVGSNQVAVPGVSQHQDGDVDAAKQLGVPVYAVDKNNIHKVDQNGNISNGMSKTQSILIDALETYGK